MTFSQHVARSLPAFLLGILYTCVHYFVRSDIDSAGIVLCVMCVAAFIFTLIELQLAQRISAYICVIVFVLVFIACDMTQWLFIGILCSSVLFYFFCIDGLPAKEGTQADNLSELLPPLFSEILLSLALACFFLWQIGEYKWAGIFIIPLLVSQGAILGKVNPAVKCTHEGYKKEVHLRCPRCEEIPK